MALNTDEGHGGQDGLSLQRTEVISQNINADTPGYQSCDLMKVDFGSVLKSVTGDKKIPPVTIEQTSPLHLPGPNALRSAKDPKDRLTYEVAPDGNGVIMEEQMVKASQTQVDYNLITNLMRKQSLMTTALGRQG